jgi:integrase
MPVAEIKPSQLNEWLAQHEGRLKNTSYNRYVKLLKQLFEIAVQNRIIADSPVARTKTRWEKPQKPIRHVPTQAQFEAIVQDIRCQELHAEAEGSADFVQFLGEAGVGQAEAGSLTLGDVDWKCGLIRFRRHKAQAVSCVPTYTHLRPLLEKLANRCGTDAVPETHLLQLKEAKKALAAACRRLHFKDFCQRNIRQGLIRRLWQSGVD